CILYSRLMFLFIHKKLKKNNHSSKKVLKNTTASRWLLKILLHLLAISAALPGGYITYINLFDYIGNWSVIFAFSAFASLTACDVWAAENLINTLYIQSTIIAGFFPSHVSSEALQRSRLMRKCTTIKNNKQYMELVTAKTEFDLEHLALFFQLNKEEKTQRNLLYKMTVFICLIGFSIGFISAYPFYHFSYKGANTFFSKIGVDNTKDLNNISAFFGVLSVLFKGSLLSFATANKLGAFITSITNHSPDGSKAHIPTSRGNSFLYGYGLFCSLTGGLALAYMTKESADYNSQVNWFLIICSFIGAAFGKVWAIKGVLDERLKSNEELTYERNMQRLYSNIPNIKTETLKDTKNHGESLSEIVVSCR
nr:hypothetical protein [Gammaproteobacteria bacterium]